MYRASGLNHAYSHFIWATHFVYMHAALSRVHKDASFYKICCTFTAILFSAYKVSLSWHCAASFSKHTFIHCTSLAIYASCWSPSIFSTSANGFSSATFISSSSSVASTHSRSHLPYVALLLPFRVLHDTQALRPFLLTQHRLFFWPHTSFQLAFFVHAFNLRRSSTDSSPLP